MVLESADSEDPRLMSRDIISEINQRDQRTLSSQTNRRTDGQPGVA